MSAILHDGLVQGSISGGGTTANVEAMVSCVNSVPTGSISGNISFFGGGPNPRNIRFIGDNPAIVATLNASLNSVGATFFNVSVQENEFTPMTDCTAFLNATRLTSNSWIGSLVICCPSGLQLFIYGTFTGIARVNRQVFCQPLL
ncbi:hypothetical protein [Phosphitispora fastidiosa]|uniref:hypothetical protein n=1 Tax=Phosphitispora fastidiosa TaxID=2837202 RepID=UPI001E5DD042|nr:hypothetical protein [Phosphitispora fastidiosa]MBU7007002.1 hypothetical protein [Phosphitispora fastidiosa]